MAIWDGTIHSIEPRYVTRDHHRLLPIFMMQALSTPACQALPIFLIVFLLQSPYRDVINQDQEPANNR